MASPTYVNSTTQGAQSTTISVTAPASIASGDHNLIFLGVPSSSITVTSVPSGWTLERTQTNSTDSTPFTLRCYKSSTSTTAASFTVSASTTLTAVRVAYRGGAGVESSVGSNDASSSTNHALATATTTVADSLVVAAGYEDSSSTSKTHTMSGWTERVDYATSGLSRVGMIATYDIVRATAGTQGGTIVSTAADFMSTISVVLAGITSQAPTVGAGADVTGHAWNTAFSRTATENDNGLTITSRAWTITAGPTGVGSTIGTAAALSWTPTVGGNYTLQYAATNSAGTGTDTMTIEVVTRSVRFDADGEDYTRSLSPALGPTLTVLGWIRLAVDRNTWTTFFGLDTGAATGTRYALQCQTSGTSLRSVAEATNLEVLDGELTVGTWYAVAVVKSSATAGTVYIGTSAGSLTTTSVTFPAGQSTYDTFRIAESGWGGEWLNGNVAAVKLWSAALTATEVANELAQYRPLRTANLYAAYQFDTGPSTADGSGNSRTLSGGAGTAAEAGPSIILGDELSLAPTVDAGADVASHYANNEVTRTATESGSGITARSWVINSGPTGVGSTIGTAAALSWTPTVTGTYVLRYSATNPNGTGTDDMSITVVAQAAPTVGAGADVTSHEAGTQFTRTATESANGSAITARSWVITAGPTDAGSEIGTAAALTWVAPAAGTYTLQYAATNAIGVGTDTMDITVTSGPRPPAEQFDLTGVKLTLPTGPSAGNPTEIFHPQLDTYLDDNFYLDGFNRMVMRAPVQGITTGGSGSTRCEFREMEGDGTVEADWAMATSELRQLTVSGIFDPTSCTDRKEMIAGQVHGESGTPPIYLAVEHHVATPRLRVFKDGPGLANILTGLTATTEITYRMRVEAGRLKLWAAVGTVGDLPATPQYDWAAAEFTDNANCYFKAGSYNKSTVAGGGTGAAIATITYFELLQPGEEPLVFPGNFLPFFGD